MFGSTADQVKAGKLFGDFVQYGYDTAPVTGATLQYDEGKAFNPVVPDAVVKELNDTRRPVRFRSAEDRAHRKRRSPRQLGGARCFGGDAVSAPLGWPVGDRPSQAGLAGDIHARRGECRDPPTTMKTMRRGARNVARWLIRGCG